MKFGKKEKTAFAALVIIILLFYVDRKLGTLLLLLYIVNITVFVCFLILNKLVKKTNWWNNNFRYTHQFVSVVGYREDLTRNYDVVNVGSNPARFAFFYEDVRGENWSTGTQGLDMDLEILRYYHSYLREGAYVLLPIVAFSSVSGYLNQFDASQKYLSKFISILDKSQVSHNDKMRKSRLYYYYPLLYELKAVRYLINDIELDRRIELTEQPMGKLQIERDSKKIIENWMKEFSIRELNGHLPDHLIEGRNLSISMMRNMILFLKDRGYKPVIVSPPMSQSLTAYFTEDIKETYIYSFVNEFKDLNILYLDYTNSDFTDNSFFFNALFMNLRGRKLFTRRVLKDIGVLNE